MKPDSTRRRFVAALGAAGAASLAGCANVRRRLGLPDPNSMNDDTGDQTPTPTPTSDDEGPFDRGEILADFEDMDGWGTVGRGGWTADSSEVYAGSQSVRLEAPQGQAAGVFRSFTDGLDLTSHDLSIALKMEQPSAGKFSTELLAPGRTNMVSSNRFIVEEYDGWLRIDLGYTARNGDPDLSNIQELRLYVRGGDEPVKAWIDDLRKIPKGDGGQVMFTFDDSRASQYDIAFQRFQELDWSAGVGVIPDTIDTPDNLTMGQLREMRDAGWDVMSHPQESRPLPAYSRNKQLQVVGDAKEYLELKGFERGARHFIAPYNGVSPTTVEILEEVGHETGFTFGACANNASMPTGQYTISRIMAEDLVGTRRLVDLAAAYDQLLVLTVHDIGPEGSISEEDFERVVSLVQERDVEVVAPSTLIDG